MQAAVGACSRPSIISVEQWNVMSADLQEAACRSGDGTSSSTGQSAPSPSASPVGPASTTNAQSDAIKIEQVMTPQEIRDAGITTLTLAQRRVLDNWLNRYTLRMLQAVLRPESATSTIPSVRSSCSPAIESLISGDIEGWDGDTIFKLDNGQIWQQASYAYTYFYAYRPDVTIYQTSAGCRMKIEDETETVLVKRIK